MLSLQHLVWLALCVVAIVHVLNELTHPNVPLQMVLSVACVVAACSEMVKVLTHLQLIPSADGSVLHLFMEPRHLPLRLCSIQILFILYVRFAQSERNRETILASMYPTCTLGAAMALPLPSIFTADDDREKFERCP